MNVAETTAARASRLDMQKADYRLPAVFFRPCAFARLLQWRALAEGTPSGVPVSFCAGPRTPKPCACHHRFAAVMAGFETAAKGGRILRQSTHAHTGQQSDVIQSIVRAALRDAAIASTYQDALDATGAALAAIAALVRAEVRHG
ncbi:MULTISPECIES: hypothetical protein [Burkholderia cepacia complex]|uniref:hypothetical protein n=1 Tax=Burkholderia cepacia complex TaxID=87882 RepID=UPI001639A576|nr:MULTISPECIES: hypothetical protein [Burkholderia cepacia complex]QTO49937.1 hypothetical protein J8I86_15425 [Burkholderia latens]